MVAEFITCGVLLLVTAAEYLHAKRVVTVAKLAFGPKERPSLWARSAPGLRVVALGACCWGLVTLYLLKPKVLETEVVPENELRHVLLALDVSPSMRLQDAGLEGKQSRMKRGRTVMESFFQRVPTERYRVSVVAFYTGAKPVVVDTRDMEVVRNILSDLPMHYAFPSGKTDLFAGLEAAAEISRTWNPKSTTLIVLSDGDTVPSTGMPKLPASIADVLVIGIGDPINGKFIDGRQSRQDATTLRQLATRLGGHYHNGNELHLSTEILKKLTVAETKSPFEQLTRREYALIAIGVGSILYAILPVLLHFFGTRWNPGVLHQTTLNYERK